MLKMFDMPILFELICKHIYFCSVYKHFCVCLSLVGSLLYNYWQECLLILWREGTLFYSVTEILGFVPLYSKMAKLPGDSSCVLNPIPTNINYVLIYIVICPLPTRYPTSFLHIHASTNIETSNIIITNLVCCVSVPTICLDTLN